jgi:hypothetical protein
MKKTLLFSLILLVSVCVNAQKTTNENELKFTKQEIKDDYKIVYFDLNHSITEYKFKDIYELAKDDNNILELTLVSDISCKSIIKLDITPEYIQKYLNKVGYDFASTATEKIDISSNKNISNKTQLEHFPKKINTGNAKQDEKDFLEAYSKWRIAYPEEWEIYKKQNNLK